MLFNCIILSLSSSIDSFGIGITYGLRRVKLSFISNIILFLISVTVTSLSIFIGKTLNCIIPEIITSLLGSFLLILMGSLIIFQVVTKKDPPKNKFKSKQNKKIYQFFISFLGITITFTISLPQIYFLTFSRLRAKDFISSSEVFISVTNFPLSFPLT